MRDLISQRNQRNEELMKRVSECGLTQEKLANFVGVRPATVSGWYNGVVPKLEPIKMLRLFLALNSSPEELVLMFQPADHKTLHQLRQELEAIKAS